MNERLALNEAQLIENQEDLKKNQEGLKKTQEELLKLTLKNIQLEDDLSAIKDIVKVTQVDLAAT